MDVLNIDIIYIDIIPNFLNYVSGRLRLIKPSIPFPFETNYRTGLKYLQTWHLIFDGWRGKKTMGYKMRYAWHLGLEMPQVFSCW